MLARPPSRVTAVVCSTRFSPRGAMLSTAMIAYNREKLAALQLRLYSSLAGTSKYSGGGGPSASAAAGFRGPRHGLLV